MSPASAPSALPLHILPRPRQPPLVFRQRSTLQLFPLEVLRLVGWASTNWLASPKRGEGDPRCGWVPEGRSVREVLRSWRLLLACLVLAKVALLTGCGGGGGQESSVQPSPPSNAPPLPVTGAQIP